MRSSSSDCFNFPERLGPDTNTRGKGGQSDRSAAPSGNGNAARPGWRVEVVCARVMQMREPGRFVAIALSLVAVGCAEQSTSGPSSAVRVVQAGWSFGFCMGPCRGQLDLAATQLTYQVSSRTGDQGYVGNRGP